MVQPKALLATFAAIGCGLIAASGFAQNPAAAVQPALDGDREPEKIAFTADGKRALVTEAAEGTVAEIDTVSGKVLRHLSTGGTQPAGVAVTPDGRLAMVTNSFSGSVGFVHLDTGKTDVVPLLGMPYDVVLSPDGATAYVAVSQLDQVAVIDVAKREITARITVGRRPRALSITPDGKTLITANMSQGSVSFIDTAARRETAQGPTPAVNLRGAAVYPNGRLAYAVGQRAQNERPTETPVGIWSNQAFHVRPNGGRNAAENIWLDFLGKDVADPDSVQLDLKRNRAYITCTGGNSVNAVNIQDSSSDPLLAQNVGACPKGLQLTPDGKELWVANSLGNDVAVLDPDTMKVTRRIPLGAASRKDPLLLGRYLFTTATIVKGTQFSCNSCHPDGHTDGISWKFVHVPDALGKEITRNVRSLRGHIADTAPFRWTGYSPQLTTFVKEEATGLMQCPSFTDAQAQAVADYVESLALAPNPYRGASGALTPEGVRGKVLFEGKAECAQCHTGSKFGAQRKASVGTTPPGIELDVPHLIGVYDSYPYLHDGRAATLEEIFTRYNPSGQHGKAGQLSPEELKDLLAYVRQL